MTKPFLPVGGSDYKPISDQQLILSADVLEVDIPIYIIDDFLYEPDEILVVIVELISEPFSGIMVNISITIIDHDGTL